MRVREMLMPGGIIGRSAGEPAGVHDLLAVDLDLTAAPRGLEADHQRVREGPGLARHVADVGELDADLLRHLPVHRLLEGLTGLDEARDAAVHRYGEGPVAGQERFVAPIGRASCRERGCQYV